MENFTQLCEDFGIEIIDYKTSKNIICRDNKGYKYKIVEANFSKRKKLPLLFKGNPFAIENIKQYLVEVNSPLFLLSEEYKDVKTKLEFGCSCHPDKTQWHTLETIRGNCGRCVYESRRKTGNLISQEEIIEICNQKGLIYQRHYLDHVTGKGTMVEFICPNHKDKGIQIKSWQKLKNGVKVCPYCIGRYKTTDDFKKEIKTINPNVLVTGEYAGCEIPIDCTCLICGHKWSPIARSLRQSGCPICAIKHHGDGRRVSREQFIDKLSISQPTLELVGDYTGSHELATFKCKIHNNEFISYPANILNESSHCPMCRTEDNCSLGEKKVRNYLEANQIPYDTEHIFPDCRYILPLKFDFYIPSMNTCIEYDGQQHFEGFKFHGETNETVNAAFKERQIRDGIKNDYCKIHNINLIRIPYWEFRNIDSFLDDKLKPYLENIS